MEKLLIDNDPNIPIFKKDLKERYEQLIIKNVKKGNNLLIQLGYVNEQANLLEEYFVPISGTVHVNHFPHLEINRSNIPYSGLIFLACKLAQFPSNQKIIYPLRVIKEIEFKPMVRPFDHWLKEPKKSHSGIYTIERNWEKVLKVFNYFQKKKIKTLRIREKKKLRKKKGKK